jgi:hypothetical protein
MVATMIPDYPALKRELANLLCVEAAEHGACVNCEDAAIRVITKRRSVRQFLNRFANQEADLA